MSLPSRSLIGGGSTLMMYLIMGICESKLLSEIVQILGTSKCNKFSLLLLNIH